MNTFKRLLSLTLALVMTVTILCSCGKIEDIPDAPLTTGDIVTDAPVVTDAPDTTTEDTTTTPATTPEETTTEATEPEVTTTPEETTEATTTTDKNDFTVEEMSAVMYATISLNVRSGPSADFGKIDTLKEGEEVIVTGRASTGWYQVLVDGKTGYVSHNYVTTEKPSEAVTTTATKKEEKETESTTKKENTTVDTSNDIQGVTADDSWVKDNGWTYMYNALYKDSYRQVLNEIMSGVQNYEKDIKISKILTDAEADDFVKFFLPIIAVEYTYVRGISALKTESGKVTGVRVTYYATGAEGDKMVEELRSTADKVIGKLKSSWSDYEKILYLHDWLIKNSTPNDHNYAEKDADGNKTEFAGKWGKTMWPNVAYGSIVDGQSTCLGYAKGMFYLLSRAGYDVTLAEGIGDTALHVWVKVKIDGKWYNIDPTWDDPCGAAQNADPNYVAYSFFLVTDKYMKQTRSSVYDIKFFEDPSCTSTKYDWYIRNECYVTSESEVEDILKKKAKEAAASGEDIAYVTIKMEDDALFKKVDEKWSSAKFTTLLENYTTSYETVKKGKVTKYRVITFRLYK